MVKIDAVLSVIVTVEKYEDRTFRIRKNVPVIRNSDPSIHSRYFIMWVFTYPTCYIHHKKKKLNSINSAWNRYIEMISSTFNLAQNAN